MDTNSEKPSANAATGDDLGHSKWASLPKRKPVPIPVSTSINQVPNFSQSHSHQKWTWPWLSLQLRSLSRRSRLLIGGILAILLIALIIGLAVGLTVGKRNKYANLALPTSHGGPYQGDLTYYNPALGSCGYTNSDSEMVCAVSHVLFDAASIGSNPNNNSLCGLKLRLRRNERSVDVKVVDRCVGCAETDLDVTEAVFQRVADLDQGRVLVDWAWLETAPVQSS